MKDVRWGDVLDDLAFLCSAGTYASNICRAGSSISLDSERFSIWENRIVRFLDASEAIDALVSLGYVTDALSELRKPSASEDGKRQYSGQNLASLCSHLEGVSNTFGKELRSKKFYSLTPSEASLVTPDAPLWGRSFAVKFPSSLYDLDEAAKCLGFSRGTACIFHLMRIVETGINAVRLSLGIPDPIKPGQRNWGVILGSIKNEIERRNLQSQWTPKSNDRAFFGETHASLDAIKNAWRNTTMHIEKKYTLDEAEHIYSATRGFMMKISSRLDESGLPSA